MSERRLLSLESCGAKDLVLQGIAENRAAGPEPRRTSPSCLLYSPPAGAGAFAEAPVVWMRIP
jgi:hypothetical protein